MSAGDSRQWVDRMGGRSPDGPGSDLPPGMTEPRRSGADDYETQLAVKEQQLVDAIEHRRGLIIGIESGEELRRCELMLGALGPLDRLEKRIATLEQRVHRAGARRSVFGGFHLGKASEKRELEELIKRREVVCSLSLRADLLRRDPQAVKADFLAEITKLEHRLNRLRRRRGLEE